MQKNKDINKSLDEQCSLLSGSAICQGFFYFHYKNSKIFLTCSKGEQVNCDNIAIEGKKREISESK